MKKKICLLLTLVISLFVFSGRVEAAKEMYCIYDSSMYAKILIIQQGTGDILQYFCSSDACDSYDDSGWNLESREIRFETRYYDSNGLTECPSYYSYTGMGKDSTLYDDWNLWRQNRALVDSGVVKIEDNGELNKELSFEGLVSKDSLVYDDWYICSYESDSKYDNNIIDLYFNNKEYIIFNPLARGGYITTGKFTTKKLWEEVNIIKQCPLNLYLGIDSTNFDTKYEIFLNFNERPNQVFADGYSYMHRTFNLLKDDEKIKDLFESVPPSDFQDDTCKDLFGEPLLKKINQVMDIIKIVVPILLIGFGIIDFTKVIFSGSEDDMKKSKKKFFNRLLAAILVFIAPIFINLILSLANKVWNNISDDTCIGNVD